MTEQIIEKNCCKCKVLNLSIKKFKNRVPKDK